MLIFFIRTCQSGYGSFRLFLLENLPPAVRICVAGDDGVDIEPRQPETEIEISNQIHALPSYRRKARNRVLLGSEITLCGPNGRVPEQQLNLLKLPAGFAA